MIKKRLKGLKQKIKGYKRIRKDWGKKGVQRVPEKKGLRKKNQKG